MSSASATGLFDPFTMEWGIWAKLLFKLPASMFPKVLDTDGDFGNATDDFLGSKVPIGCSMADQSASLFGSGCIRSGELKLTMGTGSFVDVNTGTKPHVSASGN